MIRKSRPWANILADRAAIQRSYQPDGTLIDERGFQPQVPFKPDPGAFDGERDDLVTAALVRLSQASLPAKPIEGPVFNPATAFLPDHSLDGKEEARDMSRPKVVSVTPTNDAPAVASVTELHIRFDRPMDPLSVKLDWECGGFLDCEFPKYDSNTYEFTIPIHLAPGLLQQIVLNQPVGVGGNLGAWRKFYPRDGFQSADHHLAGLFVWHFRTQAMPSSAQTATPLATTLSPSPGSHVPCRSFLEIRFDQPMMPPGQARHYLISKSVGTKKPEMIPCLHYEVATQTFRIPLLLPSNEIVEFTLNSFRSAAGVLAEPITLKYQVSGDDIMPADQEKIEAGAREPRLLDFLETMRQKRGQLTSLAERVQQLSLGQKNGLFVHLQSQSATFKWQKPDRFYTDVTESRSMYSDFRMGSDGHRWWRRFEVANDPKHSKFQICSAQRSHDLDISICDPFHLLEQTPADAAAKHRLKDLVGSKEVIEYCPNVEAWEISKVIPGFTTGSLLRWAIDPRNYRVIQTTEFCEENVVRQRFLYDTMDEPLPSGDFTVPKAEETAKPPELLEENYTGRFIIHDGSDGHSLVQWAKKAAKALPSVVSDSPMSHNIPK